MRRNSYSLAAFAAAAVPGLEPSRTTAVPTPQADVDVAGVVGADGHRVLVTCPASTAAGIRLEKSVRMGEALSASALADLVTPLLGSVKLPEGGRAVVTDTPAGAPLLLDELAASDQLVTSLGEVLARIHALPAFTAETAGAERFSAQAVREAHREQFERARGLEQIPAALVQRWERMLGDDELWDFTPVFVHGDLSEESLFQHEGRITGVRDWADARIGDPAVDLAWLRSTLDQDRFSTLYAGYRSALPTPVHPRLQERAQAVGEFAVIDWLLHGIDYEDELIISDAREMIADLENEIAQIARDEAEEAYADLAGHAVRHEEHAEPGTARAGSDAPATPEAAPTSPASPAATPSGSRARGDE